MKILLKLSWLNIWRHPQRSLIMILAIMVGLWGAIFAASLIFGMLNQKFETSIEQHISHVQVHNPEFLQDYNVRYKIGEWERLKGFLEDDRRVIAFSERSFAGGMLGTATLTTGVNIIGVLPEKESATTSLDRHIIEGDYFAGDVRNPVLIGKSLADKVKARLNSRIVLTFQDIEGELTSASFRIAGIYRTSNPSLDERNLFVLKSDLDEYLGAGNIVNEAAIVITDHEEAADFSAGYRELFPELEIRTWAEVSPELAYMVEMSSTMFMIILIIILLALAFGLLNTMLMSVFERIRELGMLLAIGMNRKRVFGMILLETSFLTFTGAVAGVIAGSVTILLVAGSGIDLTAAGGDSMRDFGFDPVIYPYLEPGFFITLAGLVIITAMLTSVFPALKALKMNPAEAVQAG